MIKKKEDKSATQDAHSLQKDKRQILTPDHPEFEARKARWNAYPGAPLTIHYTPSKDGPKK